MADLLRIFVAARVPVTLWGPVGARKTRTVEALRREVDTDGVPFQVITVQPSIQDASVMHGMFYTSIDPSDGSTVMLRSIPEVAKMVMKHHERDGGNTIIFLDEMTTCLPHQQNGMLGLLTHGKFDGLDISEHTAFLMAANPEGTVETVLPLSEAIIDRGGHIPWYGDRELFLEDWSAGFGKDSLKPSPTVEWHIRALFDVAPDEVFRGDSWNTANLVPYDRMSHSERGTTNLAIIINIIESVMSEAPSEIRDHYIFMATRALHGNEWANRMRTVLSKKKSAFPEDEFVAKVREMRLGSEDGGRWEEVRDLDMSSCFDRGGSQVSPSDVNRSVKKLLERAKGRSAEDFYAAANLVLVMAVRSGYSGMLDRGWSEVIEKGLQMKGQGLIARASLPFLDDTSKSEIRRVQSKR